MDLFRLYSEVNRTGIAIDDAVNVFVEGLRDPGRPRHCAPCLLGCLLAIQPGPQNKDILCEKFHSFWAAAIRFLTMDRTSEAIEALDAWMSETQCTCPTDSTLIANLHRLYMLFDLKSKRGAYGSLAVLVSNLNIIFGSTIRTVKAVQVANGRHKETLWPTSPEDLMPYGPHVTVKAVMMWTSFLGPSHGPEAIVLLPILMLICRSLVTPAIVSSPTVCRYICNQGSKVCDSVSDTRLSDDPKKRDEAIVYFCADIKLITDFILTLATQCDLSPAQLKQFQGGHETELFEFISQAVKLLESPIIPPKNREETKQSVKNLAIYGATLYVTGHLRIPTSLLHPTIRDAIDSSIKINMSPARTLFLLLNHFKKGQICCALECPESFQTASGAFQFQRCAGCRVVVYSSKECQVRAWKDKRLPHRDICKTMRQVMDVGGSQLDDPEKFTRSMKKAKIPDAVQRDCAVWLTRLFKIKSGTDGNVAVDKLDGGWFDLSKSAVASLLICESVSWCCLSLDFYKNCCVPNRSGLFISASNQL